MGLEEQNVEPEDQEMEDALRPRRRTRYGRQEAPTPFSYKLLTGVVGAFGVFLAQAVYHGNDLIELWKWTTADYKGALWLQYLALLGIVAVAVLVVGMIAAILDKTAFTSLFMGAGLFALLMLGTQAVRSTKSVSPGEWPTAIKMVEAALNTACASQSYKTIVERKESTDKISGLQNELVETKKELLGARKASDMLKEELDRQKAQQAEEVQKAKKEGAEAKAAELMPGIAEKDKEISDLKRKATANETRIQELQVAKEELERAAKNMDTERVTLRQQLNEARSTIESLKQKNAALQSQVDELAGP
ncbi:MAG: hypothetical protein JW909_05900 [Planctomycetes bacterium]|nr:hypothetical protein [Planctomycetota bacterium]